MGVLEIRGFVIRGFWGKWKSGNYKTANFKDPHIWVSMSPNIVLIPLNRAKWQLFINIIWKSSHFFSIFDSKKLWVIAKCGHFEGFKKPRIANPRNSRPRIARTPCIFFLKCLNLLSQKLHSYGLVNHEQQLLWVQNFHSC